MQDWTQNLPAIDLDAVPAFYPMPAAEHRRPNIELDETRQLFRTPTGRRTVNALDCPNAFRLLDRLPAPGEDLHVVTKGNSPLFDIIPWIREGCRRRPWHGPQSLRWGSAGRRSPTSALLDAGKIARLDFVYSAFFRSVEKGAVACLADRSNPEGNEYWPPGVTPS